MVIYLLIHWGQRDRNSAGRASYSATNKLKPTQTIKIKKFNLNSLQD